MLRRVVVMIAVLFTAFLAAQTGFRLIALDKSFEITFPTEPKHEDMSSDSGPIRVRGHSYSCESSEWKYILTYIELTPAPADLKSSDAIDSAVEGTLDNVHGTLLAQEPLKFKGQPAKAATITVGSNTIIEGRFVYVKPRVYQLLVLHHKNTKAAFQQQFFDSFRVRNVGTAR